MEQLKDVFRGEQIPFLERELLKDWCTFRIGGEVPLFVEAGSPRDIGIAITACKEREIPLLVLGRGSNILFGDEGFGGVVLHLGQNFSHCEAIGDHRIYCQSGALLTQCCVFALEEGLSGMEPLYGIPGSVGGAVFMNAGAYGGEMKQIVVSASYVDERGIEGVLEADQMGLSYRHSVFAENGWVITGVTLQLEPGNPGEIRQKMDEFMGRRREKQPLELPSGGSTFKRPVGGYASALIDECGLKGARVGDAMVSEKHAGFVVNVGAARCQDVLELIAYVQQEVQRQKGIALEPEVILIGAKL